MPEDKKEVLRVIQDSNTVKELSTMVIEAQKRDASYYELMLNEDTGEVAFLFYEEIDVESLNRQSAIKELGKEVTKLAKSVIELQERLQNLGILD